MNTQNIQLQQTATEVDSRDFASSIEYDHPIHTLVFGNRMCGKLEIVPSYSNESTVFEVSETASREIEIKEGRGTVIFTKRTSPYSFFRQDDRIDRHDTLIRAVVPQNTLRRICVHKRLASVSIKDYEADEFSVNASLGGAIYLENLTCANFRYEAVSGACTIHAKSIDVENLIGIAYSSAHVLLSGRAVNHSFATTHKSIVDARQLETQDVFFRSCHTSRVQLGNVQSVKVSAKDRAQVFIQQVGSLDADSISKGHIEY